MFIEPNTNIRILKNVPLDITYKNTLYFTSATTQASYFMGLTKHNLVNQTYQRVQKGVARVNIKAELLYDCNYMMFQNTSFGTKWFYAFITGIEYINNVVSEITFEIDIMQTWYFDYQLKDTFVEREHSVTDNIGDNLVPENLELGEYISDDFDGTGKMGAYKIVIAATVQEEGYKVTGGQYAGIYSGLYLNVFDGYNEANAWIEEVTEKGKSDGIVSVFMMPSAFITNIGAPVNSFELSKTKQHTNIAGYVPRNKKLFTHPYNFLYVTNLDGNFAEFRYEFFSGDACTFGLVGDFSCNPGVVLYPSNYKGVTANYDEKMSLGGFPQCSWNTDSYKAWLAQQGSSWALNTATGIASGVFTSAINPIAGGISLVGTIGNALVQQYQHAIMPPQAKGGTGNVTQVALRIKDFAFMHKHITKEFAQIIDGYFDMYGYATHKVKTPNTSSRPHWNYVKTLECDIVGSVPADDMRKICDIYNKGITFWKNGSEVGNYSLDNRPSSTRSAENLSVEPKNIDEASVSSVQ